MSVKANFLAALVAACTATAWSGAAALAAPIPVTTTADGTGGPDCTLRDAIAAANGDSAVGGCPAGMGADTIDLTALTGTITLASSLPNVTSDVEIEGPGASSLTIDGDDKHRVLFIGSGVVRVSGVTIADGAAHGGSGGHSVCLGGGGGGGGLGGAILVDGGSLTIEGTAFSGNVAQGGNGGSAGGGVCTAGGGGGGIGGDGTTPSASVPAVGGHGGDGGPYGATGGAGECAGNDCTKPAEHGGNGGGGGGGANTGQVVATGNGADGGFGGGGGGAGSRNPITQTAGSGGFAGGGGGASANDVAGMGGTFGGAGGRGVLGGGGGGGAGLGGAIFVRSGSVVIRDTSFDDNVADRGGSGNAGATPGEGKGGAIFVADGATVTVDGCVTFDGNDASDAGSSPTDNPDVYGAVSGNAGCVEPLAHFQCYRTKAGPAVKRTVTLIDQFGEKAALVGALGRVCNPADQNGTDPGAPSRPEHLTRYAVRRLSAPTPRPRLAVTNELGTFDLQLRSLRALLAPAATTYGPPAPPPLPDGAVSHFACYDVRAEGPRVSAPVELEDEVGMQTFATMQPDELCAPAKVDDTDVVDAETHLLCFHLRRLGKQPPPRTVLTTDPFGSNAVRMHTSKQRLCVPSTKAVLP